MSHRAKFSGGPLDNDIIELPTAYQTYKAIELVQPPVVVDAAGNTYPKDTECKFVQHTYCQSIEDPHLYWYTGSSYVD